MYIKRTSNNSKSKLKNYINYILEELYSETTDFQHCITRLDI
jgi:hypothetical protein